MSNTNPEAQNKPSSQTPPVAEAKERSGLTLKQFIQERLEQQQGKVASTNVAPISVAPQAAEASQPVRQASVWFGNQPSLLPTQSNAFASLQQNVMHPYISGKTMAQAYLGGTQQPGKHVQALQGKQAHVGAFLNVVDTQHAAGLEQYLPTPITRLRVVKQRLEQDISDLQRTLEQLQQSHCDSQQNAEETQHLKQREQRLQERLAQLRQKEQNVEVELMTLLPKQSLVVKAGVGLALWGETLEARLKRCYAFLFLQQAGGEGRKGKAQVGLQQPNFKKTPNALLWLRGLATGSCTAWQHLDVLGEELSAIQGLLQQPLTSTPQVAATSNTITSSNTANSATPDITPNMTWGKVPANKLSPSAQLTLSANEWGSLLVQMDRTLSRLESTQQAISKKQSGPLAWLNNAWLKAYNHLFHG